MIGSLKSLVSLLNSPVGKLSKPIGDKKEKQSSLQVSRQPEDLNNNRQESGTSFSDPDRERII